MSDLKRQPNDPAETDEAPPRTAPREEDPHLSLWPLLQRAWHLFAADPATHILAVVIVVAGGTLSLSIALGPLLVGYIRLIDHQREGHTIAPAMVLEGLRSFGPAFVAWAAVAAMVFVGGLLLVLPGVVAAVIGAYAPWFVALHHEDGPTAISGSWRLFRSAPGSVMVSLLALMAINIAGSAVIAGVLLSLPVSTILLTLCFRELSRASG